MGVRVSKLPTLMLPINCVLFNKEALYTLLVEKVLAEKEWLSRMQPEDFRGLTPLFYGHVNPYRRLVLDMNERIII
jgi:hypothetical protein